VDSSVTVIARLFSSDSIETETLMSAGANARFGDARITIVAPAPTVTESSVGRLAVAITKLVTTAAERLVRSIARNTTAILLPGRTRRIHARAARAGSDGSEGV
jgi:hypothetical protein